MCSTTGRRRNKIVGRAARAGIFVQGEAGRAGDYGTAEEFGKGDPEFLGMVRRALSAEAETVGRRFGAKQG